MAMYELVVLSKADLAHLSKHPDSSREDFVVVRIAQEDLAMVQTSLLDLWFAQEDSIQSLLFYLSGLVSVGSVEVDPGQGWFVLALEHDTLLEDLDVFCWTVDLDIVGRERKSCKEEMAGLKPEMIFCQNPDRHRGCQERQIDNVESQMCMDNYIVSYRGIRYDIFVIVCVRVRNLALVGGMNHL